MWGICREIFQKQFPALINILSSTYSIKVKFILMFLVFLIYDSKKAKTSYKTNSFSELRFFSRKNSRDA